MNDGNDTRGNAVTQLSAIEARVLAVLVEKQALTPDVYPLTLNAAVAACNQKTARAPVMELEPGVVGHTLRRLEDLGLVRVVHGSRALRYEHRFEQALTLTPRQRAVLCVLMLRGAQTAHELLVNSERIGSFEGIDSLKETLDRLAQRDPPLLLRIARGPGQREDRYRQLISPSAEPEAEPTGVAAAFASGASAFEARIDALEARVAELERRLAEKAPGS
jgi:hypothetical protein